MGAQPRTADEILARIARPSHGVVTRAELIAAGVGRRAIQRRLARGALHAQYRGVYRVGHEAPSLEATYTAAVKACGEGAVLSGRAAAHLWRLTKGEPPRPEVTCTKERDIPGLLTRCCRSLGNHERTVLRGIPVTAVRRTLIDLARVLHEDELARACHEASVLYRVTAVPEARSRKLRRVLEGDVRVTLSALERRFLQLLQEAGLTLPRTNRRVGAHRVDCRWSDHRLTVELDSYRFHSSRHAWEKDRQREREAYARGDQLRRYTWGDVFEHPESMLAELRTVLMS